MKQQVFGDLFWGFIFGALVVGTAAVFVLGLLRDVQDDAKDSKPVIAKPPAVSMAAPAGETTLAITLSA